MITPKEIENKVFSSAIKGYRREEVDRFLDQILVDFEALLNENQSLKNSISNMQRDIAERKQNENSVMQTLEQAKNLMSDISASAEKRAEVIIRNAHTDAAKIVQDAKDSVISLNRESDMMRTGLQNFRARYKAMLTDEMNRLETAVPVDDFFASLDEDFIPASMVKNTKPAVEAYYASEPVAPVPEPRTSAAPVPEMTTPVTPEIPVQAPVTPAPAAAPDYTTEPAQAPETSFDDWLEQQTENNVTVTDMSKRQTLSGQAIEQVKTEAPAFDDKAKTIVIENPGDIFNK